MIKQIKISKVEDYLEIDIKRNYIVLGVDPSVHSTGIVLIRTSSDFLFIEDVHKLTVPSKITEEDALDLFTEQLDAYKEKLSKQYKIDMTIIENCFYGVSVTTIKALARHSCLAYDRLKRLSRKTKYYYPKEIRKEVHFNQGKLKGCQLKKAIVEYVNKAFELELKVKENDIADAILCATVGLKED